MKKKIAFVYSHDYPEIWRDGLYAAIQLLSFDYNVTLYNIKRESVTDAELNDHKFILGWGAFGSDVDRGLQRPEITSPKGLCIGGVAQPPVGMENYDVLFYETNWYKPQIKKHPNIVHAFGVNTKIYKPAQRKKFWDYTTVGAFALWKRQYLLTNKEGSKLAIGEIQKGNPQESLGIVAKLLAHEIMISDMVEPERLADIYRMSGCVYIPADILGGGERAVLEARACGATVEVEGDNPKLLDLAWGDIYDEKYYYSQLKKGIESCL